MPDSCILDPTQECVSAKRTEEVSGEVKALDRRLTDFQQVFSDTNNRFGARIGKLEAREDVREEQYKHIQEKMSALARDVAEFQREQKGSISELRKEHKESMEELKKGNKDILDTIAPLKHKVEDIEKLEKDVEELKGKPGETWEHIKKQGLGWLVAIILAIVAAALGLSQYA